MSSEFTSSPSTAFLQGDFSISRKGYSRDEVDAAMKKIRELFFSLASAPVDVNAAGAVESASDMDGKSDMEGKVQDPGAQGTGARETDKQKMVENLTSIIEAKERADRRVEAATVESERIRIEARRILEKANKEAQETMNAARAQAKRVAAESQEESDRAVAEMTSRRAKIRDDVEMLRAARDELLNALQRVDSFITQAKDPLEGALERARSAATEAIKRTRLEEQVATHQPAASQLATQPVAPPAATQTPAPPVAQQSRHVTVQPTAPVRQPPQSQKQVEPPPVDLPQPGPQKQVKPPPVAPLKSELPAARTPTNSTEQAPVNLENIFERLRNEQKPASAAPTPAPAPDFVSSPAPTVTTPVPPVIKDAPASVPVPSAPAPDFASSPAQDAVDSNRLEETERRIRRVLNEDESRLIRNIHQLHDKKQKKKQQDLKDALVQSQQRIDTFSEVLGVPREVVDNYLVAPLVETLRQCDLEGIDTKAAVQKVREFYRDFARNQLAETALEICRQTTPK